MSIIYSQTLASAYAYNKKSIRRLNLYDALPPSFLSKYGLSPRPSAEELADATLKHQNSHNLDADGKLGPATLRHILTYYVPLDRSYWTYNIVRSPCSEGLNLICYDQVDGLNLHDVGHFTPRHFVQKKPTQIVIHWGGLNPTHLFNCFSGTRKVSSHVAVGIVDGDPTTYQYLNLMHKAWHAGRANSTSIGIDICQQPEVKWLPYYEKLGYNLHVMENPSSRGSRECLSLDAEIKNQLVLAIRDLCNMFDIPLRVPDTDQVMPDWRNFRGILGHHHISERKWDVAPWMETIGQSL